MLQNPPNNASLSVFCLFFSSSPYSVSDPVALNVPAIKKKTVTPDTTESEGEEELSAKRPRVDAEVTEGFRLVVCVCV